MQRTGLDCSDQPSDRTLDDVSPAACEVARHYLREANGNDADADLANAADADLHLPQTTRSPSRSAAHPRGA